MRTMKVCVEWAGGRQEVFHAHSAVVREMMVEMREELFMTLYHPEYGQKHLPVGTILSITLPEEDA